MVPRDLWRAAQRVNTLKKKNVAPANCLPGPRSLAARPFGGCENGSDTTEAAVAVAEGLDVDADAVEHRHVEICQRRLAAEAHMLPRRQRSAALAGQQD